MKYEVIARGHRREAIGAHSGYRIRMSTLSTGAQGLETWPVSVYVRGSESEAEVRVQWPDGETGPWMTVPANGFAIIDRGAPEAIPWDPGEA